uniref:Uncharacterized protein n=1 Tax=Rhizophora mucronata TaxID=61149 RepID=A0A2P2N4S2_RHIMU
MEVNASNQILVLRVNQLQRKEPS